MARSSRKAALVLLLGLAASSTALSVQPRHGDEEHEMSHGSMHAGMDMEHSESKSHNMTMPTGHSHHHAGPPKLVLDPDLLVTEESYWDYDATPDGHGGLMTAHIALMTVAWGGLLPLGIMLRAVRHPIFLPMQLLFIGLNALAVFLARVYNGLTPDHYGRDAHSRMGYFFLIYAGAVMSVDLMRAIRSLIIWFKSDRTPGKLAQALLGGDAESDDQKEVYEPLQEETEEEGVWANGRMSRFNRRDTSESRDSDDTLHDNEGNISYRPGSVSPSSAKPHFALPDLLRKPQSPLRVFFKYLHIFSVRMLVFFGWTSFCTGLVVYTGTCKWTFINGCLAHYIKGSIFVWYGVITFGRYLGAWSELGWAWNKRPTSGWRSRMPTPEMVEVGHILFYGSTQTFMERWGSAPGSAFTIHQLEHISIAIMFFGTGLLGVLLEMKSIRRIISQKAGVPENAKPTAAHGWSWNFAPALTIALTGLVMSKHHQEYAFAVDVHALWGNLLFLFGVFRMMTYALLWLRPPVVSTLPSRPPTEALAAFCLIAGGILFICSSEEIVFAAMRAEVADVMLFLNLTTTAVTLFMAWIVALMAIKGIAYKRMQSAYQRVSRPVNLA